MVNEAQQGSRVLMKGTLFESLHHQDVDDPTAHASTQYILQQRASTCQHSVTSFYNFQLRPVSVGVFQ